MRMLPNPKVAICIAEVYAVTGDSLLEGVVTRGCRVSVLAAAAPAGSSAHLASLNWKKWSYHAWFWTFQVDCGI